jgi:DNA-binding CsgD family transcriptional regulator
MRARLLVAAIAVLTILANVTLGVRWVLAVAAGVTVVVVGEVVGRLVRSRPVPHAASATEQSLPPAGAQPLSPRELEVAVLIAQGLTSKEVGARLDIEKGTVDKHLEHIKNKLGINSRPQLAVWLMERRLLQTASTSK